MNRTFWFAGIVITALSGCSNSPSPANNSTPTSPTTTTAPSEGSKLTKLEIKDIKVGQKNGPNDKGAQPGDTLTMIYTGTLANGTVFDSNDNVPGKQPFKFRLGAGSVIKGWDQGLLGMYPGGERKLSIPSDLGYGSQGSKKPDGSYAIPPNSDLYFDVKLNQILKAEDQDSVLRKVIRKGSGPAIKKGDTVTITYVGKLLDDDSVIDDKSNQPHTYKVGIGELFPGIDAGILGMKQGSEFTLQMPPGTGPTGMRIPPGSTTVYDITVRKVKH